MPLCPWWRAASGAQKVAQLGGGRPPDEQGSASAQALCRWAVLDVHPGRWHGEGHPELPCLCLGICLVSLASVALGCYRLLPALRMGSSLPCMRPGVKCLLCAAPRAVPLALGETPAAVPGPRERPLPPRSWICPSLTHRGESSTRFCSSFANSIQDQTPSRNSACDLPFGRPLARASRGQQRLAAAPHL